MPRFRVEKLIRDRLPQIMQASGLDCYLARPTQYPIVEDAET